MIFFRIIIYLTVIVVLVAAAHKKKISKNYRNIPSDAFIRLNTVDNQTYFAILRKSTIVQNVLLDSSFGNNITQYYLPNGVILTGNDQQVAITIVKYKRSIKYALFRVSRKLKATTTATDCFHLDSSRLSWYGGPEQRKQYWPIEKLSLHNYSYVTKSDDNCGVAERYWLNSAGSFIYVDGKVPLFINQNSIGSDTLCLTAKKELPYDRYETQTFPFVYYIGVAEDARTVHMQAVRKFLRKPKAIPDERMARQPIWSTWARYKANINEEIVTKFADEIVANKFNNSQLEIDDLWEVCYGSLTFNQTRFPNSKNLTDKLKGKGFRVTLWVHPFINKGCDPWYSEALNKGYFVTDHKNSSETHWWNGGPAGHIDFTKTEAANWFVARLEKLQREAGIDSFKFDAGETSWAPSDPVLNDTANNHPMSITAAYINTVARFGSQIEVRSGHGTQSLPIFLRMLDKDSNWSWDNGLPTLITTLLQLNMNGYVFVLPDMIGGNGYAGGPSKELFIRWLQANVFMPSLQFSFVPWDYDAETVEICRNFTELHAKYTDEIVKRFELARDVGEPVNAPIWWIDPNDRVAQQISDEFLLGDRILSAPVLQEGVKSRNIYLPRGRWLDGNTRETISGPKWLMDYSTPLNVLAYFIRQDEDYAYN